MNEIEIKNISKKYKNSTVLKNISFSIEQGKIYGFIGENGAGKTTLMRILTKLSVKYKGEIILNNNSMGSIIENPSLMQDLTAYENIKYKMLLCGLKDYSKINDILSKVKLTNIENKKVRNFSLGMKQRLGIAMALISNPSLLILDEPINGLDPNGIIDIRNLLIELNTKYKITIFISSHILSEVYSLATEYIFIHKGKIVKILNKEQLDKECASCLIVRSDSIQKAYNLLVQKINNKIEISKDNEIKIYDYDDSYFIAKSLITNKIKISEIFFFHESLENYYLKLINTKEDNND